MRRCCKNCKHSRAVGWDGIFKCSLNYDYIPHPFFMGKKCECFESMPVPSKFKYPTKEDLK